MSYETTDRGFKHYEPIRTDYGHVLVVYESSSVIVRSVQKHEGGVRMKGKL